MTALDHIALSTADYPTSLAFYQAALGADVFSSVGSKIKITNFMVFGV